MKNTRDARGTVRVLIVLANTKKGGLAPISGNITRTLTVRNATVTEVFRALTTTKVLFLPFVRIVPK